jgi:hypothetical protein
MLYESSYGVHVWEIPHGIYVYEHIDAHVTYIHSSRCIYMYAHIHICMHVTLILWFSLCFVHLPSIQLASILLWIWRQQFCFFGRSTVFSVWDIWEYLGAKNVLTFRFWRTSFQGIWRVQRVCISQHHPIITHPMCSSSITNEWNKTSKCIYIQMEIRIHSFRHLVNWLESMPAKDISSKT